MPVILYDGSEEELMDTIEKEFSWPPAESAAAKLLSFSASLVALQQFAEEILKKRKGNRVSFRQFPAAKEGYTFTVFKQDFQDKFNIVCVKLLHSRPLHLPKSYLTTWSSVIAEL